MDAVGLATLESEMRQDARVMADALHCALDRIEQPHPAGLEACAHHLHRFYNAFEQMGLRLAKAFENHIDGDSGWHSSVLNRLALEIPGVRPAFLPEEARRPLHELRGFRHVFVHAYELTFQEPRIRALLANAIAVDSSLEGLIRDFFAQVRRELGV